MSFLKQQRLEYGRHNEEIASLNSILADIQRCQPFPPELEPTVKSIIDRLNVLMLANEFILKDYDPREQYL